MNHYRALQLAPLLVVLGLGVSGCDDGSQLGDSVGNASLLAAVCADAGAFSQSAPVLTAHPAQLWPPNHKFHAFGVADCVSVVSCDPNLRAEFLWASSDEPVDDLGDGHFAPDIVFDDCGHVQVRAERQGPKDGRVYKLGVRVTDGAGHVAESECSIVVDHDQRGAVGSDSGESYRVPATAANGVACGGAPGTPPPPVRQGPDDAGAPPAPLGI